MATSTYYPSLAAGAADQRKTGFFARVAKRFVETRTASARREMANYLTIYSDEKLASFGWSAQDIKRLRNG